MNHLELIVKGGTVRIPSIFMFENTLDITEFLDRSAEANCEVIFENENIMVLPDKDDGITCAMIAIYKQMVGNREIGNAYVRYLGSIDKMRWND